MATTQDIADRITSGRLYPLGIALERWGQSRWPDFPEVLKWHPDPTLNRLGRLRDYLVFHSIQAPFKRRFHATVLNLLLTAAYRLQLFGVADSYRRKFLRSDQPIGIR